MAEEQDNNKGSAADNESGIFSVGPPLHAVRGGYVRRRADELLYHTIVAGKPAHVVAPADCGKSSLVAASAARLRNNGFKVAMLDLAQITERDGGTDAGRWYYSIAYRLMRQLRLKIDLQDWWQDKAILSNRQRLVEFYIEVILQNIRETVVVFLDEIQCIENLPFTEHLLPSVRTAYNARTTEPDFQRLIFVLAGEGDTYSLFSDPSLSPFAVSQAVVLDNFARADIDIFQAELNLSTDDSTRALDRIHHWTGGQPYLTQKLSRAVAREKISGDIEAHVDRIVHHQLAGRAALHNEPHMSHIHRRVIGDRKDYEAMLNIYGRLRKGISVQYETESRPQRKLIANGLLVVAPDGTLAVQNRLYETVFTARWANSNLPLHWRGPALVTAVVILLTAIPFWYTQLLPKPYMRVLVSQTLALESIHDAWRNLRSFPGHADTADRLYRTLLETRAKQVVDRSEMLDIVGYAGQLSDSDALGQRLAAEFWDRRANAAMRREQRDEALLAALQALAVATPERRRIAARQVGDDYPNLLASVPEQEAAKVLFSARDMLLTFVTGARISQWSMVNDQLQARPPWTLSSLEVTPLVRRVVVDTNARVSRIRLSVNVGHARLDDLRLKLIAPSGRAVELQFDRSSSSVSDTISFDAERLAPLLGESINGTWTLSVRDEATDVNGHLHGWNLSLNSQVIVESFDRGLDIPAPAERESDNIWFGADGRYAVARALQSDNARMWDLDSAHPARSIAVPASEAVIGLSAEARYLVTVAQDSVHLWSTTNGRRVAALKAGAGNAQVEISRDGQHLLVIRHSGQETEFDLWSLESQRRTARLRIAGTPALAAIDASGERLAIADYDRAVRIWNMQSGEQLSQLDLHALASDIRLSADGATVAVVHGEQGYSLWRTDRPGEPILVERGSDRWQLRFSPSGNLLLAGSNRAGYQVYRTTDGTAAGPQLHTGLPAGVASLLAFSDDESVLLTAAASGKSRFWHLQNSPATSDTAQHAAEQRLWRGAGDSLAALAPGGKRLALTSNNGDVHMLGADPSAAEIADADDEISYVGHQGPILSIVFSGDGSLVATAGTDGRVRFWNSLSGLPKPNFTYIGAATIRKMQFSASGRYLAVLGGQRVWVVSTDNGEIVSDADLGEPHADMSFGKDDILYLGSESGAVRDLAADRTGNWILKTVWRGEQPVRNVAASGTRQLLVAVDSGNRALLLDLRNGRLGAVTLQMPGRVRDLRFAPGGTRVLLRTAGWVHRAAVTSAGLEWLDAIRTPRPLGGSQFVFDRLPANANGGGGLLDPSGGRLLVLTGDAGVAGISELDFSYDAGPVLFGTREELVEAWRQKLAEPVADVAPAMAVEAAVPAGEGD